MEADRRIEDFEDRHVSVSNAFDTGNLTIGQYVRRTVMYRDRGFTEDEFVEFMKAESKPDFGSLDLVRRLADGGRYLRQVFHQSVYLVGFYIHNHVTNIAIRLQILARLCNSNQYKKVFLQNIYALLLSPVFKVIIVISIKRLSFF